MHLRRALLLFAMVLGFAALAASISQPRREPKGGSAPAAPLPRAAVSGPGQVRLSGNAKPRTVRTRADTARTLVVSVPEPGQVELEGLGLLAAADPSTAATFPLSLGPGRYRVLFTPAGSDDVRTVGTVLVRR